MEAEREYPEKPEGLTDKQWAFCLEYIRDYNGCQAAIRAGYSENVARQEAWRQLTKANVQSAIKALAEKYSDACIASFEEVCSKLAAAVRFDIRDYMREDGTLDLAALKASPDASALRKLDIDESYLQDGTKRVKIKVESEPRIQAADRLAQMLGWDKPKRLEVDTDMTVTLPDGMPKE